MFMYISALVLGPAKTNYTPAAFIDFFFHLGGWAALLFYEVYIKNDNLPKQGDNAFVSGEELNMVSQATALASFITIVIMTLAKIGSMIKDKEKDVENHYGWADIGVSTGLRSIVTGALVASTICSFLLYFTLVGQEGFYTAKYDKDGIGKLRYHIVVALVLKVYLYSFNASNNEVLARDIKCETTRTDERATGLLTGKSVP